MGAVLSSAFGTLLAAAVLFAFSLLYKAALPKPLADIPYNRDATGKLFGDVPEMIGYVLRTKRIFVGRRVTLLRSTMGFSMANSRPASSAG